MKVIALFGRGNTGKTRCLGHLINLINNEENMGDYLKVGKDARVTLKYRGKRITICTWGDNEYEEGLNIDKIRQDISDIAVVATRTKGGTVEIVRQFCEKEMGCPLKWVEKYVASFNGEAGQAFMNNLQAEQIMEYIKEIMKLELVGGTEME